MPAGASSHVLWTDKSMDGDVINGEMVYVASCDTCYAYTKYLIPMRQYRTRHYSDKAVFAYLIGKIEHFQTKTVL